MVDLTTGETLVYERTFTAEDVQQFAEVSLDEGTHHTTADEDGTFVVHGLLTATLPTKLGGDIDFLARTMEFEFHRPVYTGQTVRCELTLDKVTERDDRYDVAGTYVCTVEGDVVMRGESDGVVRQ
jgi:acyl dehydratase